MLDFDLTNPSFFGSSSNSVDSKGRVFIPIKWRDKLGDSVILHIGLGREGEGRYLELTTIESFKKLIDSVTKLSATNRRYEALKRNLFGKTEELSADKQSRILIPKHLIEYAGLKDEIVMVGSGDHIQIWNPETYRAIDERYDHDDFCDDLEKLDRDLERHDSCQPQSPTAYQGGVLNG